MNDKYKSANSPINSNESGQGTMAAMMKSSMTMQIDTRGTTSTNSQNENIRSLSTVNIEPEPNAHTSSTFPQFPQLPIEMQVKIWKHSMDVERIIELVYVERLGFFYSNTLPPAVLHACRVSRQEGLKRYNLLEMTSELKVIETDEMREERSRAKYYEEKEPLTIGELENLYENLVVTAFDHHRPDTLISFDESEHKSIADVVEVEFRTYIDYSRDIISTAQGNFLPETFDCEPGIMEFVGYIAQTDVQYMAIEPTLIGPSNLADAIINSESLKKIFLVVGVHGRGLPENNRQNKAMKVVPAYESILCFLSDVEERFSDDGEGVTNMGEATAWQKALWEESRKDMELMMTKYSEALENEIKASPLEVSIANLEFVPVCLESQVA